MRGQDARGSGNCEITNQVTEGGVVMHEQNARGAIADDSKSVWHTARHRDPIADTRNRHVVAAANNHLSVENVPRVVEIVVDVQRCGRTDRQRSLATRPHNA